MSSINMTSGYEEVTGESLKQLRTDREKLKNTHKTLLDIMNSLGLSKSILKYAGQRNFIDTLIVVGGMIIVIIVFILAYRYKKS